MFSEKQDLYFFAATAAGSLGAGIQTITLLWLYHSYRVVGVPVTLMNSGLSLLNQTDLRIQHFVIRLFIGPAISARWSRFGG